MRISDEDTLPWPNCDQFREVLLPTYIVIKLLVSHEQLCYIYHISYEGSMTKNMYIHVKCIV